MAFTAKDVQNLRERTGCGMMDCKKAVTEAGGDMEKAIELLREKGLAAQAKKSGRIAAEGIVYTYVDEAKRPRKSALSSKSTPRPTSSPKTTASSLLWTPAPKPLPSRTPLQ